MCAKNVYLAGPMYSEAERAWNQKLAKHLEGEGYTVILPERLITHEEVALMRDAICDTIYQTCKNAIDNSDIIVAILDGMQIDDGTAWGIGYANAKGMPIYGIRTDFRQCGDTRHNKINSMIEGSLSGLAHNYAELMKMVNCS